MKKDIELLKYKLEGLQEINMRMREICEPDSEEQHHPNGSLVAIEKVLELVDDLDESEVTLNSAFEKISEIYPMTKGEVCRHLEQIVAHGGKVTYGEPEVLSHKWISDHIIFNEKEDAEYVYADKLQNLLVPKQEELETKIQELIESYKQEEDAYSNPENGWISGFIEDLKNLVEKEQKYYVLDSDDIPLLERVDNQIQRTTTELSIYEKGRDNSRFELTEQEIKGYDKRYWPFAEPVEQADFRLLF